jgi:hypothetical protein
MEVNNMIAPRALVKPSVTREAISGLAKAPGAAVKSGQPAAVLSAAQREAMIREAAYFRAERRAFAPGGELEDWFAAEQQIDDALTQSAASASALAPAEEKRSIRR